MGRKKILFMATGGTFSSVASPDGVKPALSIDDMIARFHKRPNDIDITGIQITNLDSTNIEPRHWQAFAQAIQEHMDHVDGIMLGHGTDTMAYTASALSFALAGIDKPVIVTGSARSADHPGTDAGRNFDDACVLAAHGNVNGVYVCFGGRVIHGTHARKQESEFDVTRDPVDIFVSVNAPQVGKILNGIWTPNPDYTPQDSVPFNPHTSFDPRIGYVFLIPGLSSSILRNHENAKAVIIDSFGDGGIPFTYGGWEKDIGYLLDRDIPVVVISQTGGQATMSVYEPGLRMKQRGVTPSMNIMREAAITKLMWIAGSYPSLSGPAMAEMFQKNICGEYYTASPFSPG